MPPYALRDGSLDAAVSRLGYQQVAGNRWSRPIDEAREATVDLLVPSYRTRVRSSVRYGGTNTTEDGGLALALKRPAVAIAGTVKLTDGVELPLDLSIPLRPSMLGLKVHARRVRNEDRDAVDLWTCMELLAASQEFDEFRSIDFDDVRELLAHEFGDDGPSTRIVTAGVAEAEAARRRTRMRGLVRAITGSR